MALGDSNSKALFTDSDSRVVDRLDVDVVFVQELVRCLFRKGSITDEDRKNVRGSGANGKVRMITTRANGKLTRQECLIQQIGAWLPSH